MKCYLVLKRSELTRLEKTQRNIKYIFLGRIRQSEKATYCMIPTLLHYGRDKTVEAVKRSVTARDTGILEDRVKDSVQSC